VFACVTCAGVRGVWPGVSRVSPELGVVWPRGDRAAEEATDAYLAPELRHQRGSDIGRSGDAPQGMPAWLDAVYTAFGSGEESRWAHACDRVSRELADADGLFIPILGEAAKSLAEHHPEPAGREIAETGASPRSAEVV